MVNYRERLGIDYDLSQDQIAILQRNDDTLVRALPGSGKTTILTLKLKKLLLDNPKIRKIVCISYTNVNVDDLRNSCAKLIEDQLFLKIEFQTFHRFCLDYILHPFSYLYRSRKGLRAYKTIFNFAEHGKQLIDYLTAKGVSASELSEIQKAEYVYYNFKFLAGGWKPVSNGLSGKTVAIYLNFLNEFKLIDFNLINLLSLFVIQENPFVRKVLNKSIDWIFIDEFQDVSDIQCRIIEELRKSHSKNCSNMKWFMVGDPNQSIYGFAGANPKSMYDMRNFLNSLSEHDEDCELKLKKTYRCSRCVFDFAKKNYNLVLSKIRGSKAFEALKEGDIEKYLTDLEISADLIGDHIDGEVLVKPTISELEEIINLKFTELADEEVCCIGVNRYNSIDVYRKYKLQDDIDDGEDFAIYADFYKDYEDKYGFKYFSLFICYLKIKYYFCHNRIKLPTLINQFIYHLNQFLVDKLERKPDNVLLGVFVDCLKLLEPLNVDANIFDEFVIFANNFVLAVNEKFDLSNEEKQIFPTISSSDRRPDLNGLSEPTIQGFVSFIIRSKNNSNTFDVKHIHKIKGLEYEQVIIQKIEDLPHRANAKLHKAMFSSEDATLAVDDIYNYIQELNKLYVMLTRSKKNLYIITNPNKQPQLLDLNLISTSLSC